MGVAPFEGLTRISPLVTGAEGRRRLSLAGFRANLVTLVETFKLALDALRADRSDCRAHAELYSWRACAELFLSHLMPLREAS